MVIRDRREGVHKHCLFVYGNVWICSGEDRGGPYLSITGMRGIAAIVTRYCKIAVANPPYPTENPAALMAPAKRKGTVHEV